jgi:SAM-dependent methyltransferase
MAVTELSWAIIDSSATTAFVKIGRSLPVGGRTAIESSVTFPQPKRTSVAAGAAVDNFAATGYSPRGGQLGPLIELPMKTLRMPTLRRMDRASNERSRWLAYGDKWAVSSISTSGADVEFGGWVIATPEVRERVVICCNGQRVQSQKYPIQRPDVAEFFPNVPDAMASGFECRHVLPAALKPGEALEFTCVDRMTGRPPGATYYPQFWRSPMADDPPIPEVSRRVRVINVAADNYFRDSGLLQYGRLQWALKKAAGKSFADCRRILDWGCGCGRVSRYFRDRPAGSFVGADVDAENVAWCRSNIRFGKYEVLSLHPPSTLAAESFDLVFGISVFTHLRESDQNEWLTELRRITTPGAHLLLTVHGDTTLYRFPSNLNADQLRERKRLGCFDIPNHLYDAHLAESDYYRETYHTESYVRRHWGQSFTILDIIPGLIGPQDLVVARRSHSYLQKLRPWFV